MIDIKWLCSLRWKLLIWCLSYCHPCLAKTWNSLRITWILNQVRPTGALDYELIPGKGTEKVLDAILLDLWTNALTRWPPGLQHDRPSVRSGDPVTLLWCQCPHLYPRPERSRAKGVVLFFLSTIWIDAMISSVPNPQILGGHPGGHPWRHPCFAGNYKYLFKPFRIIQIHDKGAKSTKSNVSKHHNQHHCDSGPSDGQGRIESEQRAGLQVEVVVVLVVVYR